MLPSKINKTLTLPQNSAATQARKMSLLALPGIPNDSKKRLISPVETLKFEFNGARHVITKQIRLVNRAEKSSRADSIYNRPLKISKKYIYIHCKFWYNNKTYMSLHIIWISNYLFQNATVRPIKIHNLR